MKPVKILHYVEDSYSGNPSYIILMSDNKEYISNGCIFIERTEKNIENLIRKYQCKKQLYQLLSAPGIANDKLVNGFCMYYGCKNLKEPGEYPLLKDGSLMYYNCIKILKEGSYPLLEFGSYMYSGCKNIEEKQA